jgi:hypothetical protein
MAALRLDLNQTKRADLENVYFFIVVQFNLKNITLAIWH